MVLKIFHSYMPVRRIGFFALESLTLVFIIWFLVPAHNDKATVLALRALLFAALIQAMFFYFEMYEPELFGRPAFMARRIILALACSWALLIIFFSPAREFRMITLFNILGVAGLMATLLRVLYSNLAVAAGDQKLLVLGSETLARSIAMEVLDRKDSGFEILGFVSEMPGRTGERLVNPSIVGDYSNIKDLVGRLSVDRVIVAIEDGRGKLPLEPLLECKLRGIRVEDGFDFFERLTGKLSLEYLRPSSIIFASGFRASGLTKCARRGLSLAFALAGLLLFAPVAAVTAVLVKLDSPGPTLYRQERVGQGGRPFTLFKFRSMRIDAEEGGPAWASPNDPRTTRVGRWIRKFRLDEIPQLWNVLRNDMALVGPRPERPHFVDILNREVPYYGQRFAVKPGITGWAQINYAYGASKKDALEKLKYDLFYIKHCSAGFDLYIILQTVKIVLFGKGAR
ncbi:MAG: TIGR03013 family XrtA/PEP-CTERM system glycosyltransferase [Syntrophaceae bacterium]